MKIIVSTFISLMICQGIEAQNINVDPKQGAINISLPKTPESAAFENSAKASVNEAMGGMSVSLPLYSVKSEFLEVPISLNYNGNGIKVGQESGWVGLGWDLLAGGRITADIRGCPDYFNPGAPTQAANMSKIFTRLGGQSHVPIFTFATPNLPSNPPEDPMDDWQTVNNMAQFGTGEPDVYRASFLGQSCSFYFDKITSNLVYDGEKKHFKITSTLNSFGRITSWQIWDTYGIKYFFDDIENTSAINAPLTTILGTEGAGTAWLLTKIIHPSGDSVKFTYANFGESRPAFSLSYGANSVSCSITGSNFADQFQLIQNPKYLVKIENRNTVVDFVLENRTDMQGNGTKALSEIKITEKNQNNQVKKIKFTYDYFNATTISSYTGSLSEPAKSYAKKRLKLTQLFLDSTVSNDIPPYKFYYKETSLPDKYSYGQDHYGYSNGAANTGLIPPISALSSIPQAACLTGFNFNAVRDVIPAYTASFTMDSLQSPIGGATKFIFENQQDSTGVHGPGLRLKEKKEYDQGNKLANYVKYEYGGGQLLGMIRYYKSQTGMQTTRIMCHLPTSGTCEDLVVRVGSSGYFNDNEYDILYNRVIIKQYDANGNYNGYVKKVFYTGNPYYNSGGEGIPSEWLNGYNAQAGFRAIGGHYPPTTVPDGKGFLYENATQFPLPPLRRFDGKLFTEAVYDNNNNLLKLTENYYQQKQYSRTFQSIQAFDNDMTFPSCNCFPEVTSVYTQLNFQTGNRRYSMYVKPNQSFYTVLDSTIDKTYSGGNELTQIKKYKYNQFQEPENIVTYNSDGTQTIYYTKTLAGISNDPNYISYPITTSDPVFYDMLMNMRLLNVYDLPIEQTILKRSLAGDTTVLGSKFIFYKPGNKPVKMLALESAVPVAYRTAFTPAYYSGTILIDGNYKLQDSAGYTTNLLLKDLYHKKDTTSLIWDENNMNLVAQCINAAPAGVAYTSFENNVKGNWAYTGNASADYSTITGSKTYNLLGGPISKTGLNPGITYNVSYWTKNASPLSITGTIANYPVAGAILNGWKYFEHKITGVNQVTLNGTGYIDELRIHPWNSQMTTYCYKPLVGLAAQCDANNRVTYYEYDEHNRLRLILDQKKNILKTLCYNYAGKPENCSMWGNTQLVQTFTRSNNVCATDYAGTQGTYTVPANKYFSALSPGDANAKAQADMNLNGQNYVDTDPASGATCIPMVKSTNTGTVPYTVNFTNTATSVVSSFSSYPMTTLEHIGQVAPGTYNVQFVPSATATSQITLGGVTQTGSGTITFNNVVVSAPLTSTINPVTMGSCSISMFPGYSTPTNSFGNDGTNTYFYIVFYRTSDMTAGNSYTIGTISSTCRPTATRTIPYSTGGRNWTITITTGGQMIWYLHPGSPTLFANSTVSTSTLNYPL